MTPEKWLGLGIGTIAGLVFYAYMLWMLRKDRKRGDEAMRRYLGRGE